MTSTRYLAAWIIQGFGMILLVASFVFYVSTRIEPLLFVGAGTSLITLGGYQGLRARDEAREHEHRNDPEESK